jgi:hypothetical protein
MIIFGSKKEEVAGGWRKLKILLGSQIKKDKMRRTCSTHGRHATIF